MIGFYSPVQIDRKPHVKPDFHRRGPLLPPPDIYEILLAITLIGLVLASVHGG